MTLSKKCWDSRDDLKRFPFVNETCRAHDGRCHHFALQKYFVEGVAIGAVKG